MTFRFRGNFLTQKCFDTFVDIASICEISSFIFTQSVEETNSQWFVCLFQADETTYIWRS